MTTPKVQTVLNYYELLNEGKITEAHELLDDNVSVHTPSGSKSSKAEVQQTAQDLDKHVQSKAEIHEAKEIDGKVVVVGVSKFTIKSGASNDHQAVVGIKSLGAEKAPFKVVFEFSGNKISSAKYEADVNVQGYSATI
ncbi:hypothetical protein K435DRAFT_840895 [Dendrothele bispora CBS 962.96]|uniref:SnoaL-like domain-containing protein n=1 Tax=Dendrothele bispora (strain CBS 962.96) TaxID=1314807 RepID=A0A4S8LQT1_DENBC|nr:hypothetical protein K435DRAFT_840895 [Dendrothele bispora CBS 962.96]